MVITGAAPTELTLSKRVHKVQETHRRPQRELASKAGAEHRSHHPILAWMMRATLFRPNLKGADGEKVIGDGIGVVGPSEKWSR